MSGTYQEEMNQLIEEAQAKLDNLRKRDFEYEILHAKDDWTKQSISFQRYEIICKLRKFVS